MANITKNQIKFCKDCKHFIPNSLFGYTLPMCKVIYEFNLVNGKKDFQFASVARLDEDACGVNAKLFENSSLFYNKKIPRLNE